MGHLVSCGQRLADNRVMCWGDNKAGTRDPPRGPNEQSMIDGGCPPPICVCDNGTRRADGSCPADGESDCMSCDPGYGLNGDVCEAYSCSCVGGTADQALCGGDGQSNCASCDGDFSLTPQNECRGAYGCSEFPTRRSCPTPTCEFVRRQGCSG